MPDMKVADLHPPKRFRVTVDIAANGDAVKGTLEHLLIRTFLLGLQDSEMVKSFEHHIEEVG